MNISSISITAAISSVFFVLLATTTSALENCGKKCESSDRNYRWGRYEYFYGPDGYYARMKTGKASGLDRQVFYKYKRSRRAAYPVFQKAKYAEDWRGRGYLYPAKESVGKE